MFNIRNLWILAQKCSTCEQVVKNFDKKLHRRLVTPRGCELICLILIPV